MIVLEMPSQETCHYWKRACPLTCLGDIFFLLYLIYHIFLCQHTILFYLSGLVPSYQHTLGLNHLDLQCFPAPPAWPQLPTSSLLVSPGLQKGPSGKLQHGLDRSPARTIRSTRTRQVMLFSYLVTKPVMV